MSKSHQRPPVPAERLQISLDELELDVSAFIHYLKVKGGKIDDRESASYWCLIPNCLEFCFSEEVDDFRLEKEVFSRKLWIVSKKVPEAQRDERIARLFNIFESAITENQIKAVTRILKLLKPESRQKIAQTYSDYLKSLEDR